MGTCIEYLPGGIAAVLDFLDEGDNRAAVTVDLMRVGRSIYDLGYTLSWSELAAFIRHAPPSSAIRAVAQGPDGALSSIEWQWRAELTDTLTSVLWLLTRRFIPDSKVDLPAPFMRRALGDAPDTEAQEPEMTVEKMAHVREYMAQMRQKARQEKEVDHGS